MATPTGRYLAPRFIPLAHRGGALLPANHGRENTVLAFRNAYDLGFRYLETDVQLTSDGVLVAFHDDDLRRVTGISGSITTHSLDELRRFTVGGEPIPTLDELFTALPQARFNIDIKSPEAVEPLVRFIDDHGAVDRVCVGSFGIDRISDFRRVAGSRVTTACSPLEVARLALPSFVNRLLPTVGDVFQIPEWYPIAGKRVRLVTPGSIDKAHAVGLKVHVWTINRAEDMHRLIDWGVDGLVSDAVDVLRSVLIERGLWEAPED